MSETGELTLPNLIVNKIINAPNLIDFVLTTSQAITIVYNFGQKFGFDTTANVLRLGKRKHYVLNTFRFD